MRKEIIAVAAALTLLAEGGTSAQAGANAPNFDPSLKAVVGAWAAPVYRVPRSSDLDVSVFGARASSVRRVELTIQPSGDGTLKVTQSVVDHKGRTTPGTLSIDEAHVKVRGPEEASAGSDKRLDFVVMVERAERRFPDDPAARWPIDGLVVKLSLSDPSGKMLELRFDPHDGKDSFGATLVRRSYGKR